jgi:hypothetical protein
VVRQLEKYMGCMLHSRYKAAAGSAEAMMGSDNGDADEAGSMAWSESLAVTRRTQSTGLGNGLAC